MTNDPLMLVLPRPEIEALNLRPFLRRFGAGALPRLAENEPELTAESRNLRTSCLLNRDKRRFGKQKTASALRCVSEKPALRGRKDLAKSLVGEKIAKNHPDSP